LGTVRWTCLICKHCRDKNCCSFVVSHIYISFIISDHGAKSSTQVLFMFLHAILTELQNHNLGSYLQSFKIVTYRASKSPSWVILTGLQDCDLQSFKITILGHTYRAPRLWLTELQNHNLGSYLQGSKIVTYRALKSPSWVIHPIESTVAIAVLYCNGLFWSILWCSQSGNHPYDDLAKFGYKPNMKAPPKKIKNIL
jgi:hypothetical protein